MLQACAPSVGSMPFPPRLPTLTPPAAIAAFLAFLALRPGKGWLRKQAPRKVHSQATPSRLPGAKSGLPSVSSCPSPPLAPLSDPAAFSHVLSVERSGSPPLQPSSPGGPGSPSYSEDLPHSYLSTALSHGPPTR